MSADNLLVLNFMFYMLKLTVPILVASFLVVALYVRYIED
jgi:hypothetical protein